MIACLGHCVVIICVQLRALPVDSVIGRGQRRAGKFRAAGRLRVQGASWTVQPLGRPFLISPVCVHSVEAVEQTIDLCLYQSQLLLYHLQLLHTQRG